MKLHKLLQTQEDKEETIKKINHILKKAEENNQKIKEKENIYSNSSYIFGKVILPFYLINENENKLDYIEYNNKENDIYDLKFEKKLFF
jgi:hypothetical protein